MRRTIRSCEMAFVFCTWALMSLLQILLLPVHMLSMVVTKGCDAAVEYMADVQASAVAKMKGE